MHFTRLLFGIILFFTIGIGQATEYQIVVAYPPGNQSDLITRAIADSIARNTKDKLIVINVPGGENVIAVQHFKNNSNIDLITTVSSMVIFNPVLKKNLPYGNDDFEHLVYGGTSVALWVTRPNTNLKTPEDLIKHMPPFVGGFASSLDYNLHALSREKNLQSSIVSYKGVNETMLDLLNGSTDLAILTMSGTVLQMVKSGKLHVVGSSYNKDLVIDGISIPSVSKRLGVTQFNGFVSFAGKPDAPKRNAKLKQLIWNALQDPIVQESIKKTNLMPPSSDNREYIYNLFSDYRIKVARYSQF